MSTAQKEEKEVLDKAKYIASLEESTKDPNDKSFILCIKYIFTEEFNQSKLSLPTTRKDKQSFQYLKNFVNILHILFKKNERERHELYQSKISAKILGIDLFNSVQNLQTFAKRKNLGNFELSKLVNLKESVNYIFCNYLKSINNNLSISISLYFYYLGFVIKSINTFNFLLYYFLQVNELFKHFEYKEFCPDLNSSNCLNLILLFFKSVTDNSSIEMLSIYSLLIFKYKYIFKGIQESIEQAILKKSAEQTLKIVEEKTLKNKIIVEYIFYEFINNIKRNLESSSLQKTFKENNSKGEKNTESTIEENNAKTINSIQSDESDNNQNKLKNEDSFDEISNKEGEKSIDKGNKTKNDVIQKSNNKKNEIIENNESDDYPKPNIEEINLKESNTITKEIEIGKKEELEETLNINNEKENDNSTTIENKNSINENKEFVAPNQTIDSQNANSHLDTSNNNNKLSKSENTSHTDEKIKSFIFEKDPNKPLEIQDLIKEINNMKKLNDERFEEMKKLNDERFEEMKKKNEHLEDEILKMRSQIEKLQSDNRKITKALGRIQTRDSAKNILRHYEYLLDNNDKEKIKKNKDEKWKLISDKIKENYKGYENSLNYKAFIEVVDKSVASIGKGNKEAHSINLEYYEKNIDNIIKENNLIIVNPIKICFLLQINVSDNLLFKAYDLLDQFYEDNMKRAFTQGKSLEQFFK